MDTLDTITLCRETYDVEVTLFAEDNYPESNTYSDSGTIDLCPFDYIDYKVGLNCDNANKGVKVGEHAQFTITIENQGGESDNIALEVLNKPPDWTKEIVTEVRGTKGGIQQMYRLGTLTCKGALPTGIVPAIGAIWLAEDRIEPGVYPPELAIDPEPFFKEMEAYDIYTQVSITSMV